MRKLIILSGVLCIATGLLATPAPMRGGFAGHRITISAEGSYNPNYSRWYDMFASYNMQYGGNLHVITGRYSEIGVSYNMYSMHAHHRYKDELSNSGSIKGYQVGLSWRKYRQSRGGLAPIGKFVDFNLYYHSDEYDVQYQNSIPFVPVIHKSTGLSGAIGFGSQNIFWNHVVANYGVRFGGPIFRLSEEESTGDLSDNFKYMQRRLMFKDFFSVFIGVGIIL